jgi:hypothetical protein
MDRNYKINKNEAGLTIQYLRQIRPIRETVAAKARK